MIRSPIRAALLSILVLAAALSNPVDAAPRGRAAKERAARKLYEEGNNHFNLAEYDQAIDAFKEAYQLSHAPGLLFNIAQAYRLKRECAQALQFYKNYLRLDPNATNRGKVEERLAEMEQCLQKPASPATPPEPEPAPAPVPALRDPPPVAPSPTPTPPPPEAKRPSRLGPLLVGGAGLAAAGVGTALALSVGGDYDNLKKTCAPNCTRASWQDLESRTTLGQILIGAGAAAVAAGAIWWIAQPNGAPASPRAWVAPMPDGIVLGGRF